MALCVKNILPQDVVCGANEHGEGVFRPPYFEENFSTKSKFLSIINSIQLSIQCFFGIIKHMCLF